MVLGILGTPVVLTGTVLMLMRTIMGRAIGTAMGTAMGTIGTAMGTAHRWEQLLWEVALMATDMMGTVMVVMPWQSSLE